MSVRMCACVHLLQECLCEYKWTEETRPEQGFSLGAISSPRGHLIMSGDNFELSVLERDVTGIQWVEVGVAAPTARNIQPEMSIMNQPY